MEKNSKKWKKMLKYSSFRLVCARQFEFPKFSPYFLPRRLFLNIVIHSDILNIKFKPHGMQKEKKTGGVLKGAVYPMQRCSSLLVIWRSSPAAIVNIINKRTFLLHSLIYSFLPGAAPPPLPGAPGTIFSSYNPPQLISLYILPGLKKVPRSTSRSLLITSIKSGEGKSLTPPIILLP